MIIVSALQNTAYTENKCLILMDKKVGKYDFGPTVKWGACFRTLPPIFFYGEVLFCYIIWDI